MKLNKYGWLAVLPMVFTACQDDTLVENPQQDKMIYTLSAQVDGDATMSRAQIQLNNPNSGEELFFWNSGDSFSMYQKMKAEDYNRSDFTISSDYVEPVEGEQKSATFTTETPAYATLNYTAVYPSDVEMSWGEFYMGLNQELDFTGKTYAEVWKDYFQKNMFMLAEGNLSNSENPSVSFRHLCALARFTYTNSTGEAQQLKGVNMDGGHGEAGITYVYNMNQRQGEFRGWGYSHGLSINGLTVENGETVDLYMLFFPMEFNEDKLEIGFTVGDLYRSNSIPMTDIAAANLGDTAFVAGKRYWFKLTDTGDKLVWTNKSTKKVSDMATFKAAMENKDVTSVILTNPIVFKEEGVYITTDGNKVISMSDDFSWTVNGQEENALIINHRASTGLWLDNSTIVGSYEGTADKYLVKNTAGVMQFNNMHLVAGGEMSAVKVENASFNLNWDSSIDVEKDYKYAVHAISTIAQTNIYFEIDGEINGNVYYDDTYSTSEYTCSYFTLYNSTMNGNIYTNGNKFLSIHIDGDKAVYNGIRTVKASTWDDIEKVIYNDAITTIELSNPIVFNESEELSFPKSKTITLAKDFAWGDETALFINNSESLKVMNCNVVAAENTDNTKYLFRTTAGEVKFENVIMDANGMMNAVKIENSIVYVNGASSVDVENESGYALSIVSEKARADVYLHSKTVIDGNIDYVGNYTEAAGANRFNVDIGVTVTGNLTFQGKYASYWKVYIYDEEKVIGRGWSDWTLANLQQQLEDNGQAAVGTLTLDKDITFVFDGTHENVSLTINKLNGTGRVSFQNTGTSQVCVSPVIRDLGDDVNFAFYGNIRKNFVVTTNRVKEMFEMADDRDVMEVTLKGDAVISEQITSSANLKDGEDGSYQGRLALNLMGYKLDWQAPIVMKGGILDIGADYYGGTITASSEFIHAGADADENNNYISIIVNPYITVDCATAWVKAVGANSELTKNKIVSVALNNLEEGKDAKVSVGTGYSKDENGNVLLK